jgi:hypothetical protein
MNFSKKIVWQSLAWEGVEHCQIASINHTFVVNSKLRGKIGSELFDLTYKLEINSHWEVTSVRIDSLLDNHVILAIHKDSNNGWVDSQSVPLNTFLDCIDIDISLSPFTNTLPIRRLKFENNERLLIDVLYIDLPSGQIKPMKQWYTKLENRRYKYEDETGYINSITVDEDGVIIDYPNLFKLNTE